MNFIDLFAGIGGFRLGLEQAGHECIGFCEKDKHARKSYKAIHGSDGEVEWHDITSVSDEQFRSFRGSADIITAGFPCQSFSIAGARRGFSDTRGTMFFQIARAAEQIKPRVLFLENVKGLLSHDKGRTFATILTTLDELGYDAEWQINNSAHHAVPQNRERVVIIGHFRGSGGREILPIKGKNANDLKLAGLLDIKGDEIVKRVYRQDGIAPALNTMQGGQREPKILQNGIVRKLTPKECWRLQGFPDWAFEKAAEVNSDSQLYKQAGNAVTINVVYEISKRLGGD